MAANSFYPSTWEGEAELSLARAPGQPSSRIARATQRNLVSEKRGVGEEKKVLLLPTFSHWLAVFNQVL